MMMLRTVLFGTVLLWLALAFHERWQMVISRVWKCLVLRSEDDAAGAGLFDIDIRKYEVIMYLLGDTLP